MLEDQVRMVHNQISQENEAKILAEICKILVA